ncbi:MAG: phosphatase PAP2 family protein [Actinomycetota bacterium]|nr:phosphatase PAP2 family protein [Actinomycetota bacterium]
MPPAPSRLGPDERFGLRTTLVGAALLVLAIPFGLLVLLVRDHWAPLRRVDDSVANGLHPAAVSHPAVVTVMKAVSLLGGPEVVYPLLLVAALLLYRRGLTRLAVYVGAAGLGAAVLDKGVKLAVGRSRPLFSDPVAHASGNSFPSGHALGSLVGYGVLLLVALPLLGRSARWWVSTAVVLLVASVGYTRVGLGVHYVSDVLGGWLLGAAWLAAVTGAFRIWRVERGRPAAPLRDGVEPAVAERAPGTAG